MAGHYGTARSVEAMRAAAPDHARRAQDFKKSHPHVTIMPVRDGWEATWLDTGAPPRDGETVREHRAILGHLMDYLEARFRHDPQPRPGTVFTDGARPNTGHPADPEREQHYPMTAHCRGCELVIRRDSITAPWEHEARRPGEDPPGT